MLRQSVIGWCWCTGGSTLGRLLAALSYFGLTGALVPLAQPDNPFVVRHARRGIALHMVRTALVVPVLALPVTNPYNGWSYDTLMDFAQNLSLIVVIGVPAPSAFSGAAGVWILVALIFTWGLQFLGMMLAVWVSPPMSTPSSTPIGRTIVDPTGVPTDVGAPTAPMPSGRQKSRSSASARVVWPGGAWPIRLRRVSAIT